MNTKIRMIMTPMERRAGRFMRAPDHPLDGGGQNNADGNSGGDSANANSAQNNTGQAPDYSQFWNSPPSEGNQPPARDSAGGNQSDGGTQQSGNQQQGNEGQQFGQQLAQRLSQTQFNPVFTDKVVQALESGNLNAVNDAISGVARQATQQAVVMAAEVMQRYGEAMMSRLDTRIKEQLGNRDNDATLMENFPQVAANPAIAPMVKMVFDQSLVNTKGDRQKAIQMTKDMLTLMTTNVSSELGLNTPPPAGGDGMTTSAKSLVADLLGR